MTRSQLISFIKDKRPFLKVSSKSKEELLSIYRGMTCQHFEENIIFPYNQFSPNPHSRLETEI